MLAEEVRCEEEDGIDEVRLGAAPVSPRDPVPVGERVAALEAALRRMDHEIRTRRLVVTDSDGSDRIVGEVVDGHAELRLDLPGTAAPARSSVLVFSAPERGELGEGVGIQLWLRGETVLEVAAWRETDGRWTLHRSRLED